MHNCSEGSVFICWIFLPNGCFYGEAGFLLTRLHYSAAALHVFGMEAFSCLTNESTGILPFGTSVLVFSSWHCVLTSLTSLLRTIVLFWFHSYDNSATKVSRILNVVLTLGITYINKLLKSIQVQSYCYCRLLLQWLSFTSYYYKCLFPLHYIRWLWRMWTMNHFKQCSKI